MGNTLRGSPFVLGQLFRHGMCRGGQRRAFTEPKRYARRDQRRNSEGKSCRSGRDTYKDHGRAERAPRTECLAGDTANQLAERIGIGEGG
jgi:hypothetical protein